jgi:hypothetical protein
MASTAIAVIEPAQYPEQNPLRNAMQSLVLDGLSSPHTRRAYEQALDEFLIWLCADTARPFTKAAVQRYRTELQAKGLASASVNVRISAIRRLALEAGDNGLLAPEIAAAIGRAGLAVEALLHQAGFDGPGAVQAPVGTDHFLEEA